MESSRIEAIPFFADLPEDELDRRAPVATQRLRAMVDERRAQDAQRALAKQRAQDE
jgi:hypothetical protein